MGTVTDQFNAVYRDYVTEGVAASGLYEPEKRDIRAIGPAIEDAISSQTADQVATAVAAAAAAVQAAGQAQGGIFMLTSAVSSGGSLPFEIASITGGGGTGGTPGFYLGTHSGSSFQGFVWGVQVGSDGKAVPVIVSRGISPSNTAPTLVMPTISGLTGATTPTATVVALPASRIFQAPSADGRLKLYWQSSGGVIAAFNIAGVQWAEALKGQFDSLATAQALFSKAAAQLSYYNGSDFVPLAPMQNGVSPLWYDPARDYIDGNFRPLGSQLPVYSTLTALGDSFGVGANASPNSQGFAFLVAARFGATFTNNSVGGTVLSNQNDGGGVLANNGRDRFRTALLDTNGKEALIVAMGFNDARRPSFVATEYRIDLDEVVSACLAGGYEHDAVTIVSPWWITDTGLATGTAGFTGQSRSGFEAFVAAARQVAYDLGVPYFDAYAWMRDRGGAALISSDNIHPTNAGHAVIAAGLINERPVVNRRSRVRNIVQTPGTGTLSTTCDRVLGAVSYDFQYCFGSVTFVWSASNNQASPAASWSGLTAGTYRVRARARFADGGYSPWAFANVTVTVN